MRLCRGKFVTLQATIGLKHRNNQSVNINIKILTIMKRKKLLFLLALLMTAVTGAWAQDVVASGNCGTTSHESEVTWALTGIPTNYTLTISGTGAMADMTEDTQPWKDYRTGIKSVVVENGVTAIGQRAFFNYTNLSEVTIQATSLSIGNEAFAGTASDIVFFVPGAFAATYQGILGEAYVGKVQVIVAMAVTPSAVDATVADAQGTVEIAASGQDVTLPTPTVEFHDGNGASTTRPDWINYTISQDGDKYVLSYTIAAYTGTDARKAYFRVYATDAGQNTVYSLLVTVTQPAAAAGATYSVNLTDGTINPATWTGKAGSATGFSTLPLKGVIEGQTVTVKYNEEDEDDDDYREVKTITAKIVGTIDLSTLTTANLESDGKTYIVPPGMTLTGKLSQSYKIQIPDGGLVTLAGVTINGANNDNYSWAGITCEGDATIVLKDGTTNTVKGFYEDYPGIYVPMGKTLTIQGETAGTGTLTASPYDGGSDNSYGAGIGSGNNVDSSKGFITITGGTVTAIGGSFGAGIGTGYGSACGDITITGGIITATGGKQAAGIGGGYYNICGDITITNGVTSVTATRGERAGAATDPYSIGAGNNNRSIGTVTIGCTLDADGKPVGGTTGQIATSPYTYTPGN